MRFFAGFCSPCWPGGDSPPSPPQQGPPQDQPLVDLIAELKLIRSLQVRVKRRTGSYNRQILDENEDRGQATQQELLDLLQRLSEREYRIKQIIRDIVLGKNQ
jgi:hypothetical protein